MIKEKSTEEVALGIRHLVFNHVMHNNGGYLSQACSASEQLAWLYNEELKLGEPTLPMLPKPFGGTPSLTNTNYCTGAGYNGPTKPAYDRLFIAPAHYALVAYATLVEVGRMSLKGLEMFNIDGSSVEMIGAEHSPGMEVHNGTLGIGLSTAAGLAWGRKRKNDSGRVWIFMSDGELQEGQTWEALQACAHHKLDNIRAIIDINGQQCDGAMETVMSVGDIRTKISAFGALCVDINGHDLLAMRQAAAIPHENQPLVILARSSPYHSMPSLKRYYPKLHYVRFKSEEEREEMNTNIATDLGIEPVDLTRVKHNV